MIRGGTWVSAAPEALKMNRTFILSALLLTTLSIAHAQDISGDWQGTLDTGMGHLRLVLHITKTPDGKSESHARQP
jgi:hypothetical protein